MVAVSACPEVEVLQQLALGQMPPAEVERLAQHCEHCERCIQLLHSLKAEDTLVEAMAAQGTVPERPPDPASALFTSIPLPVPPRPPDPAVDALIERLRRLPPVGPEADRTVPFAV